ncbi:BTB/POZ domain-containing protein 3-like [Paramacrobiotus metropolitanus]|uniref:BTB/POZ domain-containing protein 3-like n=1 Tax=Paramacrobiotus metropolitanus TaxID=2943436 RepID=UPI002445BB7A|nr:BTB/POZ domain-containing protein 3-like [Paramacrobiotus metropolitanus]
MSQNSHGERRGTVRGVVNCMKGTLANGDLCDVQFTVGLDYGQAQSFRSHRYVLSMRSDVFHAMFNGSLAERCKKAINIPDVHPEAFANMLSYVYTDEVQDLNEGNAFRTLACADKYDLPLLVDMCSSFIHSHLNTDNCLVHLDDAIHYGVSSIVAKCLELVDASSQAILQSKQFASLQREALMLILQRDTLSADENTVYQAVERWAAANCARNHVDPTMVNRREILGDALFLVRFPLLSDAELADGPAESGLLLRKELLDIFLYKHAVKKPELPYSTSPRNSALIRIDTSEFVVIKDMEKVFVKHGGDNCWLPGEVRGVAGSRCVVSLCGKENLSQHKPENVIRAADILKTGQKVYYVTEKTRELAVYCLEKDESALYLIQIGDRDYNVKFAELAIPDSDVIRKTKPKIAYIPRG